MERKKPLVLYSSSPPHPLTGHLVRRIGEELSILFPPELKDKEARGVKVFRGSGDVWRIELDGNVNLFGFSGSSQSRGRWAPSYEGVYVQEVHAPEEWVLKYAHHTSRGGGLRWSVLLVAVPTSLPRPVKLAETMRDVGFRNVERYDLVAVPGGEVIITRSQDQTAGDVVVVPSLDEVMNRREQEQQIICLLQQEQETEKKRVEELQRSRERLAKEVSELSVKAADMDLLKKELENKLPVSQIRRFVTHLLELVHAGAPDSYIAQQVRKRVEEFKNFGW